MINAPLEFGISAVDAEKLMQFYLDTFGLTLVSRIDVESFPKMALSASPYTVFRLQSSFGERLKILGSTTTKVNKVETENHSLIQTPNRCFLAFIVDDLIKARKALLVNGGEVLDDCVELREGMKISVARDIEGNLIEMVEYNPISSYRSDLTDK